MKQAQGFYEGRLPELERARDFILTHPDTTQGAVRGNLRMVQSTCRHMLAKLVALKYLSISGTVGTHGARSPTYKWTGPHDLKPICNCKSNGGANCGSNGRQQGPEWHFGPLLRAFPMPPHALPPNARLVELERRRMPTPDEPKRRSSWCRSLAVELA